MAKFKVGEKVLSPYGEHATVLCSVTSELDSKAEYLLELGYGLRKYTVMASEDELSSITLKDFSDHTIDAFKYQTSHVGQVVYYTDTRSIHNADVAIDMSNFSVYIIQQSLDGINWDIVGSTDKTQCNHQWKLYEGFTNSYQYCEKCDQKK